MQKIYLDYHLRNYPKMTNQDIIKLVYQAVLGPLHFSQLDYEKALFLLRDELKQPTLENENLYEHIGSDYIRMNIKTYNKYGFDIPLLIEMFNESCTTDYKLEEFRDYLLKCIDPKELKDYDYTPVSHSNIYKDEYFPHYRVLNKKFLSLKYQMIQFLNYLDHLPINSIVALEGRCASGKTTLAKKMASRFTVIPIDDFFLPDDLKTEERLKELGGNIHYELVVSTLKDLKKAMDNNDTHFTYLAYDCSRKEFYSKEVKLCDKVIIEGVYSSHPLFSEYIKYIAFLDVDKETQMERINDRELKDRFINEWIPLEEEYFTRLEIFKLTDIII